jgi:hypothetical protein
MLEPRISLRVRAAALAVALATSGLIYAVTQPVAFAAGGASSTIAISKKKKPCDETKITNEKRHLESLERQLSHTNKGNTIQVQHLKGKIKESKARLKKLKNCTPPSKSPGTGTGPGTPTTPGPTTPGCTFKVHADGSEPTDEDFEENCVDPDGDRDTVISIAVTTNKGMVDNFIKPTGFNECHIASGTLTCTGSVPAPVDITGVAHSSGGGCPGVTLTIVVTYADGNTETSTQSC